jgi:hypothetical protein
MSIFELCPEVHQSDPYMLLQMLVEAEYEIAGVTRPFTSDEIPGVKPGLVPQVLQAVGPCGETVLLPFSVVRLIEREFIRVVSFSKLFIAGDGSRIEPVNVFQDNERSTESTITLYELIRLLESSMNLGSPCTVIIGLFTEEVYCDFHPIHKDFLRAIPLLNQRVVGRIHNYDIISFGKDGIVSFENSLYPLPAILEHGYGYEYFSHISIKEFIRFLLNSGYADRVIILPRVRFRQGEMSTEFEWLYKFITREFKLSDLVEIQQVSDAEFSELGIPVFRGNH